MTGLSEARLAEIAAIEAAASKGPWLQGVDGYSVNGPDGGDFSDLQVSIDVGDPADAVFIADARTAVPELREEVDRQRKVILRLTGGADAGVQRVRLHKSEAGAWRVRWQLDGRPKSKTFRTEAEAQGWAAQLKGPGVAQ